jgi:hypothetical protein
MFAPPNSNGMDGSPPGPPSYHLQPYHQQPAPRQRTAIACRYCRRRKIRCSGFETSPEGRCANCMRFNQECVFTPVSSQAQAFVPAHAVLGGRGHQQLYGPHGQPLPAGYGTPEYISNNRENHVSRNDRFERSASGLPPPSNHSYGLPSPGGNHVESGEHGSYSHPPSSQPNQQSHQPSYGRRNSFDEFPERFPSHPPSPPPHPASTYPSPPNRVSASYSPPNYVQGPTPPPASRNYYPGTPNPDSAPQRSDSPISHMPGREHPSVSPQPHYPPFHPPMLRPARETSSGPSSPGGPIPSMQLAGIIDPPQSNALQQQQQRHQRSAADGDMLSRLNSRTGL